MLFMAETCDLEIGDTEFRAHVVSLLFRMQQSHLAGQEHVLSSSLCFLQLRACVSVCARAAEAARGPSHCRACVIMCLK